MQLNKSPIDKSAITIDKKNILPGSIINLRNNRDLFLKDKGRLI